MDKGQNGYRRAMPFGTILESGISQNYIVDSESVVLYFNKTQDRPLRIVRSITWDRLPAFRIENDRLEAYPTSKIGHLLID